MFQPKHLNRYAAAAARAAVAAGSLLARRAGRPRSVTTKRSAIDLVTEVDRAAERLILKMLQRADPSFGFLGEEQGERGGGAATRWVVDPIDGTTNFVHGLPIFGVSIGLEHRGAMVAGVIYDPMRRELFSATKGGGTFCNGRRIRVSTTRLLARSLLSTGFSTNFLTHNEPYLSWFRTLQRRSHGVRRIGSTVWCLTAVAAGRLEGFYERDLWPWDIAAGLLIVQEAGGRVTNLAGRRPALEGGELVATNGRIHHELLRTLKSSGGSRVKGEG
jgi:myo-inositol-1(or 4)-monophosphatase